MCSQDWTSLAVSQSPKDDFTLPPEHLCSTLLSPYAEIAFFIITFGFSHTAVHQSPWYQNACATTWVFWCQTYKCPNQSTPAPQLSPPGWLYWNNTPLGFQHVQSAVGGALSCSQECW